MSQAHSLTDCTPESIRISLSGDPPLVRSAQVDVCPPPCALPATAGHFPFPAPAPQLPWVWPAPQPHAGPGQCPRHRGAFQPWPWPSWVHALRERGTYGGHTFCDNQNRPPLRAVAGRASRGSVVRVKTGASPGPPNGHVTGTPPGFCLRRMGPLG